MAPGAPEHDDPLDPVFRALAHPVRRRLLDMLKGGALTTGDLAAAFPEYSRFAIMQHLAVLEEARLVISEKDGRLALKHLNAAPLREVYERWVGAFEGHWAAALVGLKRELEAPPNERAAKRASEKRARAVRGASPGSGPIKHGAARAEARGAEGGGKASRKGHPRG